jgi:hypothetical protein
MVGHTMVGHTMVSRTMVSRTVEINQSERRNAMGASR